MTPDHLFYLLEAVVIGALGYLQVRVSNLDKEVQKLREEIQNKDDEMSFVESVLTIIVTIINQDQTIPQLLKNQVNEKYESILIYRQNKKK